jgi:hypothetical protein
MQMRPTSTLRRAWHAALLGSLVAWLATGCIGLWRGDYYTGLSSGGLEGCVPFNFDVSIEEGGRIMGLAATTYPFGTVSWDVKGMVTDFNIVLETRTEDPRAPERLVRWRGRRGAISLEVTEEARTGSCPAPRTATLNRK